MLRERKRAVVSSSQTGLWGGFRLRHLLLAGMAVGVVQWAWPRSAAAWTLRNQAVSHANYALCMVGPMGPRLLRDEPEQFRKKVRRRVLSAQPTERPLTSCAPLAEEIGVEQRALRLHSAEAQDFVEYANTPRKTDGVTLQDLDTSLARLESLAASAWPFVPGKGADLMNPSAHAREAGHDPEPAQPGVGSGLSSRRSLYRSTAAYGDTVVASFGSGANASVLISKDRGVNWSRGGGGLSAAIRDKCVGGDEGRAFTLSTTSDDKRIILSHGGNATPQAAVLSTDLAPVAAIACDGEALVAALVEGPDDEGQRPIRMRICSFRGACRDLSPPNMGKDRLYYPLDVARISGDTVVARTSGGITRVTSSRDDGRSWVPWTVVYDRFSDGKISDAPFRLLVVGASILLYSGSLGSGQYSLLVSEDHGATFVTPSTGKLPTAVVGDGTVSSRTP